MAIWDWVVVACCVAALIFIAAGALAVFLSARRMKRRAEKLFESPVFLQLEALQLESTRLTSVAARAERVTQRLTRSLATIRKGREQVQTASARAAIERMRSEFQSLVQALK